MPSIQVATFCLFLFITGTCSANLPSNFITCHRSDPNLNKCLQTNVEDAIKKLKDGAPDLNISPLEPLSVAKISIGGGDGPVNVKQDYQNVKIWGLTNSKITKYIAKLDENYLYTESMTPSLRMEAKYKLNGRILLIPVTGNGDCNVTMTNLKVTHTLKGSEYTKKDKKYLKFATYDVTFNPEKVHFHFDNLFNGDKALGASINQLVNDNWKVVFDDAKPGWEETFSIVFKDITSKVFKNVPIDEIFIEQ